MESHFRNNLVENLESCSTAGLLFISQDRRVTRISGKLLRVSGYEEKEVLGSRIEDFVPEDYRRQVVLYFRRLLGKSRKCITFTIPIVTKDRKLFYFNVLLLKEEGGFLCMMVENTREKIERIFYGILKEVNRVILKSSSEKEVFRRLTEIFGKHGELSTTGFIRCDDNSYSLLEVWGSERESFEKIVNKMLKGGECILLNSLKENRILIFETLDTQEIKEEVRKHLKAMGAQSMAVVPIYRMGEPYVVMLLLSPYKQVFLERYKEILRELKADLEFILEKIEKERLAGMFLETFESGKVPMVVLDRNLKILRANSGFLDILGVGKGEVEGRDIRDFVIEEDLPAFERYVRGRRSGKGLVIGVKKGKEGIALLDAVITKLKHGKESFYILVGRDITYEKELERKLTLITKVDQKTGVFSRDSFMEEMKRFLSKFPHQYHLLIVADIKNFSEINRVYGHKVGDEILKQFAERLKKVVYGRDFVGRLGADEFGIFFVYIQLRKISTILERILEVLKRPFRVGTEEVSVAFNLGVVVYPFDGKKADELVQKVFVALKRAKEEGENNYKFFSKKFQEDSERYIKAHNLLTRAFKENRIEIFYQPIYDGQNLELMGFEGLMRITENGKIIPPSEYIDILERSELSVEVDLRNLRKAEEFFRQMGTKKRFISLNVSPRSFKESRFIRSLMDFPEDFREHLVLEITERLIVEDIKYTKKVLSTLRRLRVRVFIDDFGTGYSSFSYLDELPVDGLKIDMSFVRKIVSRKKTRSVVRTIISLCKELGITTTAEGVEEEQQLKLLREFGCDLLQGYYFSQPLTPEVALRKTL
ncbi:MAG: EAL domain-containing protein [Aquificae bacterium]|nr:EAL domain-containing protein [Aquificota bacterium]